MVVLGSLTRRVLVSCAAAALTRPLQTPALDIPTYSLKGVPGLGSVFGADAPRPELGVIGRGKDNVKTGRLNFCERKGCISSFSPPDEESYVPPWTYQPGYNTQAVSSFSARRAQIKEESVKDNTPKKSLDEAYDDLVQVVAGFPGATIIKKESRCNLLDSNPHRGLALNPYPQMCACATDVYAEFEDSVTGAIDDVEFLFSSDTPIVGYRSAPRVGKDDKKGRARIRDIRKALSPAGWKSVGRIVE